MKSFRTIRRIIRKSDQSRQGSVLVLAAGTLVLVFAFTAFTVDVGYITTSKAEMQKTADAAALAGTLELQDAYGAGKVYTMTQAESQGRAAAQTVAGLNRSAGNASTYVDPARDVRFGQYHYDDATDTWIKSWGVTPYNMVEVTVHRDQAGSTNGDNPLDLFFAPVIGTQQANLAVTSTAVLRPGVGFKKIPGYNIGVLPITLDVETWDNLIQNGVGTDNYTYNANGTVSSGADGIKEVNLYPVGNVLLPPGNRGTVDFGGTNNSTSDISRQIRYGLNDDDWDALADQGITELRWDGAEYDIQGDTGLSAGIKDDLESIKGMPRAIPLFTEVSGPGNNAIYTIVRFVGIRIMNVKLTGAGKQVIIQPAPFNDGSVEYGEVDLTTETILAPPSLVP